MELQDEERKEGDEFPPTYNTMVLHLQNIPVPQQKAVKNPTSENFSTGWDLSNQAKTGHM